MCNLYSITASQPPCKFCHEPAYIRAGPHPTHRAGATT